MNLQEALDLTLDVYAGIADPHLSDAEATVRAAARRLLEGEQMKWCLTHADWQIKQGSCRWSVRVLVGKPKKPCRIVSRRLVEWEDTDG